MRKIKNIWVKFVHNHLCRKVYNVNFSTPDDRVHSLLAVDENAIRFFWLKSPIYPEDVKGELLSDFKGLRECVSLTFYKSESIDRLIKKLEEIKLNIQLNEAYKILKAGGTMNFTHDGFHNVEEIPDGVTVATITCEFKMPEEDK